MCTRAKAYSDPLSYVRKSIRSVVLRAILKIATDCIVLLCRRPQVNTQLYSSREKADLAQLIRVMIAYNLTYQQERGPDGQYHYKLEPSVDTDLFALEATLALIPLHYVFI